MTAPDNAFEAQDKTQLTAGGSPVAGEFVRGDLVGGSYEVVSFIGAGGMGNVYCVRHAIMQTEYALKTLSAEKVTEVAWRRFQNEAQAIARMNHPNVVAIYNLGFHDGRLPYYVMDILHGKTLLDLLREKGRLETNEALRMFIEVCAGIGYAHKKGIVHRDIKPPNIVLLDKPDPSGATIKIVDFGIAKLSHTKELANQQLTSVGEVCGSPFYMSPEQCEAGKIDARSDIYSLGCTLFEALTGSPPFKGRNAVETMMLHHTGTPPTLKAASGGKDFPPMLEMAAATLLAKAPMDRYQNMERLAQDLQTILQGSETAITPYALPRSENRDLAEVIDQRRTRIGAPEEVASESRQHSRILSIPAAVLAMVLVSAAGAWWLSNSSNSTAAKLDHAGTASTAIGATASVEPPTADQPHKAADLTPFSSIITAANGQKSILFHFPTEETIGAIEVDNSPKDSKQCQGDVTIPLGYSLYFFVGGPCYVHPEYLDRFRSDDFAGLIFQNPISVENLDERALQHITHLKSVSSVTFYNSSLTGKVLPVFDQLPNLQTFIFEEAGFTPADLAKTEFVTRLKELHVQSTASATPLLQRLKGSPTLTRLYIEDTPLSHVDYELIGTLKNLTHLKTRNGGGTNQDVAAISNLAKLEFFDMASSRVTSGAAASLNKMHAHGLKSVHVLTYFMKEEDYNKLHKDCPGLIFE